MNIARVLYPVEVLGPGKRLVIWLSGCPHHCPGCSNPELWKAERYQKITVTKFLDAIHQIFVRDGNEIDGVTITGGEPFFQLDELEKLIMGLQQYTNDILVYTGYTIEELLEKNNQKIIRLMDVIAVLIDGRYMEELNTGCALRGSSNQVIHILNESMRETYEKYLELPNQIQNFTTSDGVISVGIHAPGFNRELKHKANRKGLIIKRGE